MSPRAPLYPLRDVEHLVKEDKIGFSLKAEREYRKMQYTRSQIRDLIVWLDPTEFDTSVRYTDDDSEWDVYITRQRSPDGVFRVLYVKLKIDSSTDDVFVQVTSFHPSGC